MKKVLTIVIAAMVLALSSQAEARGVKRGFRRHREHRFEKPCHRKFHRRVFYREPVIRYHQRFDRVGFYGNYYYYDEDPNFSISLSLGN